MKAPSTLPRTAVIYSYTHPETKMVWRHYNRLSPKIGTELKHLDPLVRDALLQEDTRPRATHFEDGILVILRGVNHNQGAEPEDMVAMRIWLTDTAILSFAAHEIRAINDLNAELQAGKGPASPAAVLAYVAQRLVDRIEPVVTELDEDADALEASLDESDTKTTSRAVSELLHSILQLRRYLLPQRDALASLMREPGPLISEKVTFKLRETVDDLMRINESLDTIRERLHVLREQLAEQRDMAMNQRLFVLAILSAIFLPLSFFTGLLGVNIGGIPGADWPYAFAMLCVMMLVFTGGLYWLFRRLKWI